MRAKLDAAEVMAQYSSALRRLSKLTGFSQPEVLRAEAGVTLKTWAARTKVATQENADKRTFRQVLGKNGLQLTTAAAPGDITVNAGVRGHFGRVWVKSRKPYRGAGKGFRLAGQIDQKTYAFRPMNYHWRRGTWIDIAEAAADVKIQLTKKVPMGRAAIGLARQSVIQIADELGIDLATVKGGGMLSAQAIAKARAAIASNGRAYKNGSGVQGSEGGKDYIDLLNRLPYAVNMKMDERLLSIVSGRAKFFEQSYKKGAFDSIRNTTRAFPQLMSFSEAA